MKELKIDLKPLLEKSAIITLKNIRGPEFVMSGSGSKMVGSRHALFGSRGMEFEKFRDFGPEDDANRVDWVASLRAQKTLIRVYSEEQNKEIIFFVDVSSSMSYSSHGKLKNEYAAELVATSIYALANSGDAIGMITFTDKIGVKIDPDSGMNQFARVVRELSKPETYEGKFDFDRAISDLVGYRKRSCVLIIVSDFIGLKPGWEETLKRLRYMGYELIGICIRDPLDDKFPQQHFIGQVVISDPFGSSQMLMEPNKIAEKYKEYNKKELGYIKNTFTKARGDFLLLHTNEPFIEKLSKFFLGVD